jgi:hypothetical protein
MATGGQKADQAVVRRMAYSSFDDYKKLIYQRKHAIVSRSISVRMIFEKQTTSFHKRRM